MFYGRSSCGRSLYGAFDEKPARRGAAIDQAMKEKLAAPLEQELFHGWVLRQADRAVVDVCRLTRVP